MIEIGIKQSVHSSLSNRFNPRVAEDDSLNVHIEYVSLLVQGSMMLCNNSIERVIEQRVKIFSCATELRITKVFLLLISVTRESVSN